MEKMRGMKRMMEEGGMKYRERRNHRRYGGRQREERIEGVKVKIPTFKGTYDPKVYLKWKMKVEKVFACYNYNEEKNIKWPPWSLKDKP